MTARTTSNAVISNAWINAHYGLNVRSQPLGGEHENNYRLQDDHGRAYVLKLFTRLTPRASIDFQVQALRHIAAADANLPVPHVIPARNGEYLLALDDVYLATGEQAHFAILLTFLSGKPLVKSDLNADELAQVGTLLGRLDTALADFSHPASDYPLLWDMKRVDTLDDMHVHIADSTVRKLAQQAFATYQENIVPHLHDVPWQVIHNDFNPHNLLVQEQAPHALSGIIDFGDMIRAPRVFDLGVACAYYLGEPAAIRTLVPLIRAYNQHAPLTSLEQRLLLDCIRTRLAMSVTISQWRASRRPQNRTYLLRNYAPTSRALITLDGISDAQQLTLIQQACNKV